MAHQILLLTILRTVYSYILFDDQSLERTWDAADSYCQTQCGSRLASIHSQQDWNEVLALGGASTGKDIWIGLRDWNSDGGYTWSDSTTWNFGQTFNQDPWKSDQPNNPAEECVIIFSGARQWGDTTCGNRDLPFICNGLCGQATSSPTTHTPTTSNPTTVAPTTTIPTTTIPTTTAPTTAIPTTAAPTTVPSATPSLSPSKSPTKNPSKYPSKYPTKYPIVSPSITPTKNPTQIPTTSPFRNGEIGAQTTSESEDNNNGQGATVNGNSGLDMYTIIGVLIGVLLVFVCCIVVFFWFKNKKEKQKREEMIDKKYEVYNNNVATELTRVKSMSSNGEQEVNDEINIEEVQPNVEMDTNTNMIIDAVNAEPDVYNDERQSAVKMWLDNIDLVQYYQLFVEHGIGDEMNKLLNLTEEDLENMGIKKMAHRKRIILQIDNDRNMCVKHASSGGNGEQYNDDDMYENVNDNGYVHDGNGMLQNDHDDNTMIGPVVENDIVTKGATPMGDVQGNGNESDGEADLDHGLYGRSNKVTDGNMEQVDNDEDNENLLSENEDDMEESEDDMDNQLYQKPDKITNN
eukprot:411464_1